MATKSQAGELEKKRRKKGRKAQKTSHVPKATRIKISEILEQFRTSEDETYTFQDNLANHERALVHMLCKKIGLKSKSRGRGEQRRISVCKDQKGVDSAERNEDLSFGFSKETRYVLQDLFSYYPPDDAGVAEHKFGESSRKTDNRSENRDYMFCKPMMTKSEIANKVEAFASKIEKDPYLRQITEKRSKLPIASFQDVITSALESHQVVLICGQTGCGKTTQVPQFLLDRAWSRGETAKIICTQPRRISAISVAERIASERGENVGDSVGYKIRLERKGGRNSSLVLCTNGVMLRVLVNKGSGRTKKKTSKKVLDLLCDITHIIADEIHERDRFSDFMLAIIRDLLHSYPRLRLVLMSATIDAERFSKYFDGCPIIQVPGFTYPVKTFYLEDVLSMMRLTENNRTEHDENSVLSEEYKVALDEAIDFSLSNDEFDPLLELISSEGGPKIFNYQHSKTGASPLMVFAQKGRVADVCMLLSFGADCHLRSNTGMTALDFAEQDNHGEASDIIKKHMEKAFSCSGEDQKLIDKYLSDIDLELIDCVLIEKLLRKICNDSEDGAVLIFLPGWDDINRTREKLLSSNYFQDSSKFVIIPLHSMVPSVEQKKVFKQPPPGCRKIILSTNISETSVTIEDVVYVIDSGRMKEKSYDPFNKVSTFQSSWISKASAKQREGRAGRCRPGICYHLYSKVRASSLPDFQVPEIKRMPIEELCLQVKLLDPFCKIENFLKKTLDAPLYEAIHNAIIVLQDIGALSSDEELTDLGKKLGSLPVHPLTSKMLLIAILLNCLDPALTLACASAYRDPFILPMLPDERKKAASAKLELASFYGGHGDQVAVIAAFECWTMAKEKGEEARFCSQYFLSPSVMKMISRMRTQLEAELCQNGFISNDASLCSLNARDPGILHAVLVASRYPSVGRLLPPTKNFNRSVVETAGGNKVRLHQHSTNFKLSVNKSFGQSVIVFDEITRGDGGLHIRNCSVVGLLPLLLLAKEIAVAPTQEDVNEEDGSGDEDADAYDSDEDKTKCYDLSNLMRSEKIMSSPENSVKVIIDRWLPIETTALDVAQIYCLRERLSSAIFFKVSHPKEVLPEHLGLSLYAMACCLSYDGMTGIDLPPEFASSLYMMISATDNGPGDNGKEKWTTQPANHYPSNHGRHMNPPSHYQGVGMNGNQMLASGSSTSVALESPVHGLPASNRNHSKRRRGNRHG